MPNVNKYSTPYTNSYNSISGVDIKATFAGVTFGNLQAISYSITREKAPIYTMGSPEPRGYSRGKRGIAGSLVFIMFDSHALLESFRNKAAEPGSAYQFISDKDEPRPRLETQTAPGSPVASSSTTTVSTTTQVATNVEGALGTSLSDGWEKTTPWYSDQIPPFNVTLVGVNESGYSSQMAVLGVEILNEGFGISIDDIVSEQQMTYIARSISPWTRILTDDSTFKKK